LGRRGRGKSQNKPDDVFKRDEMTLLAKWGRTAKLAAQELDVSQWNLRDWRHQYGPPVPAETSGQLEAVQGALRRGNDSLRAHPRQEELRTAAVGIAFHRAAR